MLIFLFLLFLGLFGAFVAYTNDIKETFSLNNDELNEIELDEENCEKRVWDESSEKGWRCAAPKPKDKLEYKSKINVKYHDTIDDIKSQNPDMDLDLNEIKFRDINGNEISKFTSKQQNLNKFSGDGKMKYGYSNYVPNYTESVKLGKIHEIALQELKNGQRKLQQEFDTTYNNNTFDTITYYNSKNYDFDKNNYLITRKHNPYLE